MMDDLNITQMKNVIKDMRVKQFENAREVMNITSNAIIIHKNSIHMLKNPEQRKRYKSILKDAMDILELLDKSDAVLEGDDVQ